MLPEAKNLAPFEVRWDDVAPSPTDLSFLLDAPAGKDGFVRVAGEHLVVGGRRLRIWGVNLTGAACLPPKESARKVARHLAKFGLNSVRLHYLDGPAPQGLIADGPDTERLDPEMLDRLDYFLAECYRAGIYANLNLNVYRRYRDGDDVPDHDLLGVAKNATYYNRRLIDLQKAYARDLLTHRNPYTGRTYAAEPGICLVELTNENSLTEGWVMRRLIGEQAEPPTGIWSDIPPRYARELTDLYNAHLRERYGSRDSLAAAWASTGEEIGLAADEDPWDGAVRRTDPRECASYARARFRDEAAFYVEVERRYNAEMAGYLREELGVRCPVLGTSDHNHYWSGLPLVQGQAELDLVDGHVYWQHPRFPDQKAPWSKSEWTITNSAMVNEPDRATVTQLARSAVRGRPYIVSETNHPFPNEHASEGILSLGAYAALQDWDGIYWYTYGHAPFDDSTPRHVAGFFDLHADPVKMSQIALGALLFIRGDVRPAERLVEIGYTRKEVLDSNRVVADAKENFNWRPGLSPRTPLIHRLRVASYDRPEPPADLPEIAHLARTVSDTGEIAWDLDDPAGGVIAVDSSRTQMLLGYLGGRTASVGSLTVEVDTPFSALVLVSLDDRPVSHTERLILGAAARVANDGMAWDEARKSLGERFGGPPTLIEPVVGRITLIGLAGATGVRIQPLDAAGLPLGEEAPAEYSDGGWSVDVGQGPVTVWYLVTVEGGGRRT